MQTLMTAITVTAGMAFSLAIAILVEEWIFGKVFGLFFLSRLCRSRLGKSAETQREDVCCS